MLLSNFGSPVTSQGINRKPTSTARAEDQENKAKYHRKLSSVSKGEPPTASMHHPVGDRHLAGKNKGHRPGKHSQQYRNPTKEFQDSGNAHQRMKVRGVPCIQAKELLGAMWNHEEAHRDAQEAQGRVRDLSRSSSQKGLKPS
jgi:hypothetical protein